MGMKISENNYKWIYTYDYAPDSVWDEWRTNSGVPEWIAEEASDVMARVYSGLPCFVLLSDSHFAYNGTWEDTVRCIGVIAHTIKSEELLALEKGTESQDVDGHFIQGLRGIIHLGDLSDGLLSLDRTKAIEERCIKDMQSIGVPLYLTPGNHDYNYFRGNPEVCYPATPQYYVDYDAIKLRMIFIDSFDPKEQVRYGFTDYCIHWLDAALRSMPEGFVSIIFSHVPPLVRLQAWTKDIRNRNKLMDVLNAYADKILAFINGHNHCDLLYNELHNGKFPVISINCAKCEYFLEHKPEGAHVPERALGDRTQESFDIMQIDTANRKLYFTRFGAGEDRMVEGGKAMYL